MARRPSLTVFLVSAGHALPLRPAGWQPITTAFASNLPHPGEILPPSRWPRHGGSDWPAGAGMVGAMAGGVGLASAVPNCQRKACSLPEAVLLPPTI